MITNIKKLTLGLSAAALAIGGVACAQAPANAPQDKPGHERPRIDANGDGTVTRAEAQAAATALFARLDVNKDGKLDQADRELGRQQKRDRQFARLDTNGDGSISKAEFAADKGPRGPEGRGPGKDAPPPPGGPRGEGPGADGPDGPGKDGHGPRGRHGGRGFGGHGFGGHGDLMALAHDADTNKDGAISQAEFMAAAMKRFDAEDTNHDGQITKAEREAAHAAQQAKWEARKADRGADKKADKKPAN